jgi:P-type E1-E2 ATPase
MFGLCNSIIVYRSSPQEKSQMVKFVMENLKGAFTCAIGDGANDINMIQTAHIGVGIEGNEGNQAAYFSDYSIPEF